MLFWKKLVLISKIYLSSTSPVMERENCPMYWSPILLITTKIGCSCSEIYTPRTRNRKKIILLPLSTTTIFSLNILLRERTLFRFLRRHSRVKSHFYSCSLLRCLPTKTLTAFLGRMVQSFISLLKDRRVQVGGCIWVLGNSGDVNVNGIIDDNEEDELSKSSV